MEDSKIIDLFLARSESAVEELQRKYERDCMRTAQNVLSSRADAEECVNDAYLAVWNRIPPEIPDPLGAYVCRITRNIAVSRFRRETAEKRRTNYARALDELTETLGGDEVEDAMSASVLANEINEFLARLDTETRIMFVRRYWFGDSVTDIAKRLRLPARAVSVKLFRARERLRGALEKKGYRI